MEILELTSTLGIHACDIGAPILVEELTAAGQKPDIEFDCLQQRLEAEFQETRRGVSGPAPSVSPSAAA